MKYAVVHEWLTPLATGGSELVVQAILDCLYADIYALIDFESCNPDSYLYGRQIGTTFLQHLPRARQGVQKYLPLLPLAIEQLDLRDYDILVSSSHAVAKGILASPHQLHICYCHTPMRYAWDLTWEYLDASRLGKGVPGLFTRYLLHRLRQWDVISANRVDFFIANSRHTARRIWRCYRRQAQVIYPPVNLTRFTVQEEKDEFYVVVSRLVSYKHVREIVQAFNQLGKSLVVIGDGPDLESLRSQAKANVQILGRLSDEQVNSYLRRAKGFVYAAYEDFGIALVEAQACGTPVIAYGQGGATETVRDLRQFPKDSTGWLFSAQTPAAIAEGILAFEAHSAKVKPQTCRWQAEKFSTEQFQIHFKNYLQVCQQKNNPL
ncbi:MAG: glycosyltransferase [Cyanobacteria bacterium P01_H01_bin.15]